MTAQMLGGTGSDASICSGSLETRKPNQEVDLSCWQADETDQSGTSQGLSYNTPAVITWGFPSNVPSSGLPDKLPTGKRQAVSAAAAWNAVGNWPN